MVVDGDTILQNHKPQVAAIFGVTGLVGRELAKKLISNPTWKVYGIARKPARSPLIQTENYHFISCDLLNPIEIQNELSSLSDVTHVFWVTWSPEFPIDSPECYEQNKAMLSNVMDVVLVGSRDRLKHVSVQTGAKHYVSLKDVCSRAGLVKERVAYYNEECPRVGSYNFYYGLEDVLKEKLGAEKVAWSVQRPGLITGISDRTWYNFMGTLGVYGSICKHLNLPFVFGGTRACWEERYLDISDARLVAEQHIWASTSEHVASSREGQAFNAINGGGDYTWKELWPAIGTKFGIEMEEGEGMLQEEYSYSKAMEDKGGIWREIAKKNELVCTKVERLANWGFLDVLFRCPAKMLCSREKVERLGFTCTFEAMESVLYWIDAMRDEKLIP